MPSIKAKVASRLDQVNHQLGRLPELPANLELEIRKALMNFSATVKSRLRSKDFSAEYGRLSEAFRDCILLGKPKFVLKDKSDIPVLEISDEESDISVHSPTPKRGRGGMAPPVGPPSKRARANGNQTPSTTTRFKTEDATTPNSSFSVPATPSAATPRRAHGPQLVEPFMKYRTMGRGFRTLRQIYEDIRAQTKAGMPNVVSQEVYDDLCVLSVKPWDEPMKMFLGSAMGLLRRHIDAAMLEAFGMLKERLVVKESQEHMNSFLDGLQKASLDFLNNLYMMESHGLFTNDRESLARYEAAERRHLAHFRHWQRWKAFTTVDVEYVQWESLSEEQRVSEERRQAGELLKMGPDPFEKELRVAAYVRGYYRLAALRFADTISMAINSLMFPRVTNTLDFYLDQKLGLIGNNDQRVFERLMAEDKATATKRDKLKIDKEKFERAMQSINVLEQQSGVVESNGTDSDMEMEA